MAYWNNLTIEIPEIAKIPKIPAFVADIFEDSIKNSWFQGLIPYSWQRCFS